MTACRLSLFLFAAVLLAGCPLTGDDLVLDYQGGDVEPPARVRVQFSVRSADGEPIPRLTPADFEIINDVQGRPFQSEGGGEPYLGEPTNLVQYTVLALDMSDSIVNNGTLDQVIDAALAISHSLVRDQPVQKRHRIAVYAFGSTVNSTLWVDFTDDYETLDARLEELRTRAGEQSFGGTNLYGAYLAALERARIPWAPEDSIVTRSAVLVTDGTHEASNPDGPRLQALASLDEGGVDVYTVGIEGDYDEDAIRELATSERNFFQDVKVEDLIATFSAIADRMIALADSNYVLSLCTPVESGDASITIRVHVGDRTGSLTVAYPTDQLTGDVSNCDPREGLGDPADPVPAAAQTLLDSELTAALYAMTGDASYLYWSGLPGSASEGAILRMPKSGGPVEEIYTGTGFIADLVAADGYLYWAQSEYGQGAVVRMATTGGAPQVLVSGSVPTSLAVDGAYVYYTAFDPYAGAGGTGSVRRVATSGGSADILVDAQNAVRGITVSGGRVFWIDGGTYSGGEHNGDGAILSADTGGGDVTTLAIDLVTPTALAVDGSQLAYAVAEGDAPGLYLADRDGTGTRRIVTGEVTDVALDGDTAFWTRTEDGTGSDLGAYDIPTARATGLATGPGVARSLIADPDYLYWVWGAPVGYAGDGAIVRLAR